MMHAVNEKPNYKSENPSSGGLSNGTVEKEEYYSSGEQITMSAF